MKIVIELREIIIIIKWLLLNVVVFLFLLLIFDVGMEFLLLNGDIMFCFVINWIMLIVDEVCFLVCIMIEFLFV